MKTSSKYLGLAALLCSTAGMAATVEVRPTGTCSNPGVSCDATIDISQILVLTVHGDGFPSTAGSTLGLTWDTTVINVLGVVATAGTPFTGGVIAAAPWNPITIIGPLVGAQPSGSFDTYQITIQALAMGSANLVLVDDSADLCWTDATQGTCVPTTYTQASINVVPVPAAAWLIAPAILAAGRFSRRRKAA